MESVILLASFLLRALFAPVSVISDPVWMHEFIFTIDPNYVVHVYTEDPNELQRLEEAKKNGKIGQYRYRLDKAHVQPGQDHVHVSRKNNELFALNKDGTAHDKSHQTPIPRKVADALRNLGFKVPENNFIETYDDPVVTKLVESQRLLRETDRLLRDIEDYLTERAKEGDTERLLREIEEVLAEGSD